VAQGVEVQARFTSGRMVSTPGFTSLVTVKAGPPYHYPHELTAVPTVLAAPALTSSSTIAAADGRAELLLRSLAAVPAGAGQQAAVGWDWPPPLPAPRSPAPPSPNINCTTATWELARREESLFPGRASEDVGRFTHSPHLQRGAEGQLPLQATPQVAARLGSRVAHQPGPGQQATLPRRYPKDLAAVRRRRDDLARTLREAVLTLLSIALRAWALAVGATVVRHARHASIVNRLLRVLQLTRQDVLLRVGFAYWREVVMPPSAGRRQPAACGGDAAPVRARCLHIDAPRGAAARLRAALVQVDVRQTMERLCSALLAWQQVLAARQSNVAGVAEQIQGRRRLRIGGEICSRSLRHKLHHALLLSNVFSLWHDVWLRLGVSSGVAGADGWPEKGKESYGHGAEPDALLLPGQRSQGRSWSRVRHGARVCKLLGSCLIAEERPRLLHACCCSWARAAASARVARSQQRMLRLRHGMVWALVRLEVERTVHTSSAVFRAWSSVVSLVRERRLQSSVVPRSAAAFESPWKSSGEEETTGADVTGEIELLGAERARNARMVALEKGQHERQNIELLSQLSSVAAQRDDLVAQLASEKAAVAKLRQQQLTDCTTLELQRLKARCAELEEHFMESARRSNALEEQLSLEEQGRLQDQQAAERRAMELQLLLGKARDSEASLRARVFESEAAAEDAASTNAGVSKRIDELEQRLLDASTLEGELERLNNLLRRQTEGERLSRLHGCEAVIALACCASSACSSWRGEVLGLLAVWQAWRHGVAVARRVLEAAELEAGRLRELEAETRRRKDEETRNMLRDANYSVLTRCLEERHAIIVAYCLRSWYGAASHARDLREASISPAARSSEHAKRLLRMALNTGDAYRTRVALATWQGAVRTEHTMASYSTMLDDQAAQHLAAKAGHAASQRRAAVRRHFQGERSLAKIACSMWLHLTTCGVVRRRLWACADALLWAWHRRHDELLVQCVLCAWIDVIIVVQGAALRLGIRQSSLAIAAWQHEGQLALSAGHTEVSCFQARLAVTALYIRSHRLVSSAAFRLWANLASRLGQARFLVLRLEEGMVARAVRACWCGWRCATDRSHHGEAEAVCRQAGQHASVVPAALEVVLARAESLSCALALATAWRAWTRVVRAGKADDLYKYAQRATVLAELEERSRMLMGIVVGLWSQEQQVALARLAFTSWHWLAGCEVWKSQAAYQNSKVAALQDCTWKLCDRYLLQLVDSLFSNRSRSSCRLCLTAWHAHARACSFKRRLAEELAGSKAMAAVRARIVVQNWRRTIDNRLIRLCLLCWRGKRVSMACCAQLLGDQCLQLHSHHCSAASSLIAQREAMARAGIVAESFVLWHRASADEARHRLQNDVSMMLGLLQQSTATCRELRTGLLAARCSVVNAALFVRRSVFIAWRSCCVRLLNGWRATAIMA